MSNVCRRLVAKLLAVIFEGGAEKNIRAIGHRVEKVSDISTDIFGTSLRCNRISNDDVTSSESNGRRILTGAQQLLRWATVPEESGPKSEGAAVPLSVGGAGSLSNAMSPGTRPTSVPSGVVIHPAVWLQYTNVADGADRTTVP